MADDEKILRFIVDHKDDERPITQPPSSAGADRAEESPRIESARDRIEYERLEQDRKHSENWERILSDIQKEEDTPLNLPIIVPIVAAAATAATEVAAPAASSVEAPLPAQEATGWTSTETPASSAPAAPAGGATASPVTPNIPRWGSGAVGPSDPGSAYFPGGINLPPMPPSVAAAAPAGAATQAAGAGANAAAGALPGMAAFVQAAGSAVLTLIATPAGEIAIAFAGVVAAATGLTGLFLSAFDMLEKQLEEYNAQLSLARAQQDLELTLQKMKSGDKAADVSSELIKGETDFYKELIALSEKAINLLGPALGFFTEITNELLLVTNAGLEILKLGMIPLNAMFSIQTKILRFIRKFISDDSELDDKNFQDDVARMFAGITFAGGNHPVVNNNIFPKAQANQPDFR